MEMNCEIVEMKGGRFTLIRIDGQLYDVKQHSAPIVRRARNNHGTKSKVYGTYVSDDELAKVHRAISKVALDYVPTSPTIAKETGMTIFRVRASIDILLRRGSIRKIQKNGKVAYESLVTAKE